MADHLLQNEAPTLSTPDKYDDDWQMFYTGPDTVECIEPSNEETNTSDQNVDAECEELNNTKNNSFRQTKIANFFKNGKGIVKVGSKWQCKYCKYKNDLKRRVVEHVKVHVKTKNSRLPLDGNGACSLTVNPPALDDAQLSKSKLNEGEKSRQPTSDEDVLLKCPFCPTVSLSRSGHESHIIECHINEESEATVPACRVSSRPSTSQYKYSQRRVEEISKEVQPVNISAISPDHENDFEGFTSRENSLDNFEEETCSVQVGKSAQTSIAETQRSNKQMLSCPLCKFTSSDKLKLAIHADVDHPKGSIEICRQCLYVTSSLTEMNAHKKSHGSSKMVVYSCSYCYYKSLQRQAFKKHKSLCLKIIAEKGYDRDGHHQCPLCSYRSNCKESYKGHLLNHVRYETLTCPRCPFQTARKDMYTFHLQTEHQLERVKMSCDKCDFATINENAFEQHMKSHASKISQSRTCFMNNAQQIKVESGLREANSANNSDDSPGLSRSIENCNKVTAKSVISVDRRLPCILCSKRLFGEEQLLQHLSVHASDGKMMCPTCNYTSDFFPDYHKHMFHDHGVVL